MSPSLREHTLHYLVAIAAPTIVVAIRFVAGGLFGDDIQYMLFVAAVMLAAFYGGWKPGVVATLLSALAGDYFLIEPHNSFYIEQGSDRAWLVIFLVVGGLVSWLLQSLHNSRRSLEAERTKARRGEQQIRSVVDNVIDAIITIDAAGKIESFNPAAARIFGYSISEIIGQNVRTLMPEPYSREHDGYLANYLRTGKAKIIGVGREVVGRRKNGSTFPMELAVGEFSLGDRRSFTGVVRDITERKRAEDMLRDADRRKNEFLATLAHELRNPLAPIRNAVQVLLAKDPRPSDLKWGAEMIERQVRHMARLLDDLLDVSRITHGKLQIRTERVELATIVQSGVEANRASIDERGQQLVVRLPRQPVYLDADPVRLTQVFSNLLNNAAKYSPPDGLIQLTAEQSGSNVCISLRDHGIGISAEMIPHVFEVFSQAKDAVERSQGGLGIGLSLVRELVELHGGSVEARSSGLGKGSEFVIRLPVVLGPAVEPPAPRVKVREREQPTMRRALIVDDLKDSADSLAILLRAMGHEAHTVYDGEQAVIAAQNLKPDLILLDLGMPKLTGYDACRLIRLQPWAKGTVLVALTGWGQEDDRLRAVQAGFHQHIVKPVDPGALSQLLASLPAEEALPTA